MSEPRAFAMSVPADSRYLKIIRRFFQPIVEDLFGKESSMLLLALDEACSNVVKHRNKALVSGQMHVRVEVDDERVRFRIGDFCAEKDIPNIKPRELADVRPGGLGTHFIAEIMDRVVFEPEPDAPGRVALVLEKAIPPRDAHAQESDEHQDPRS